MRIKFNENMTGERVMVLDDAMDGVSCILAHASKSPGQSRDLQDFIDTLRDLTGIIVTPKR